MTRIARTSRAAALGAAALLALTACAGQSQDAEQTGADQSAAQSESTSSEAGQSGASESGDAAAPAEAQEVSFSAGDCLTNKPGARDVGTFEKVDCEGEHNAEYLWAVPEKSEDDTTDTESVCRAAGTEAGQEVDATVSATELRNSADGSQHCLVYALGEGWEGQIVDPAITLEDAQATAGADS